MATDCDNSLKDLYYTVQSKCISFIPPLFPQNSSFITLSDLFHPTIANSPDVVNWLNEKNSTDHRSIAFNTKLNFTDRVIEISGIKVKYFSH
jgi:hypothetical protein